MEILAARAEGNAKVYREKFHTLKKKSNSTVKAHH